MFPSRAGPDSTHNAQTSPLILSVFCADLGVSTVWRFCRYGKAVTVIAAKMASLARNSTHVAAGMTVANRNSEFMALHKKLFESAMPPDVRRRLCLAEKL